MMEVIIGAVILAAFFIAGFAVGSHNHEIDFQTYQETIRDSINQEIKYSKALRESNDAIMRLTSDLERIKKDRYFG